SVIRHVIQSSLRLAGERIKFEGFGDSNYKSKDISEAFRTLERTYLISLVYPTTNVQVPLTENRKKSPKLHTVDTGILNYYAGIQVKLLSGAGIDTVFEGKVAEHIVGQELLAIHPSPLYRNVFWVRDKKQSGAEIDYIIQHNSLLIPVEVKRGKTGKLRSLMEFMDACPHGYAVRIYSGKLSIDKVKTFAGKDFLILNLPFYLTGRIREYLHRFISEKS
ncbi:MAG: DUF4143 domain-containing protein, partial [Bacteroidetes bacterium]|nr:DUF4143 domain-containing protein [Bacteroidota bacterium]